MGVVQNVGTVTANITGSVATAPPGTGASQTIITIKADGTGAAATLYTVPANKILYITGWWIANFAGAAASPQLMTSADAPIVITSVTATSSGTYFPISPIASFAAGTNVRYQAAGTTSVGITGYLETV